MIQLGHYHNERSDAVKVAVATHKCGADRKSGRSDPWVVFVEWKPEALLDQF